MKTARPFTNPSFPVFLTLALILFFTPLRGQKKEVDAVYLNTGEIYRGRIMENINPDLIQLETLCYDTRLFYKNEVLCIQRETIGTRTNRPFEESPVRGYFNHTDLGFLIGSGNDQNVIFGFHMVNGYKLGKRYFPGIGSHTDNRGGMMISAGAGTSIRTGSSSTLVISLEYRFQNLKSVYTEDWNDEILNLKTQYNRIAFRIGYIFE
jgi:hypothetical protein